MIQVNLLPGGKKRAASRRRLSFSLPKVGGPKDRWVLGAVAFAVIGIGVMAWLIQSQTGRREELQLALEEAVSDSATYSDLVARTAMLMARRDSIAQRVGIIQQIDGGRYIWPHILDEVARALPEYTWLGQSSGATLSTTPALQQVTGGPEPRIRLIGQAGSVQALTVFMDELEASPFLRGVTAGQTSQMLRQPENQLVYSFEIEVGYEQPPLEFLTTVPLLSTPAAGAGTAPPAP